MAAENASKIRIQQVAQALGFDDCRITDARPPESREHYQAWVAAGCHGRMGYLERNMEKRCNPALVLPHARSIVTLATSYAPPIQPRDQPNDIPEAAGVVARYARYSDYHDILAEKLKQLTQQINGLGGAETQSLWYVDTGPILERDLAQRAGIGFIGKHTNLVSRRLGNWFFLAEILTTLDLPPDPSEKNRCGSCERCLTACPTEAITKPFHLDARRCIAYLTIELKGSIPIELRPLVGNRIFGCDDCLAICPWNRFAQTSQIMKSHVQPDLESIDLEAWLNLSPDEFKIRFRGTPFYRSKWRGMLRNVCVAVGNTGTRDHLASLEKLASHPEELVAEHAHWAIEEIERRWPIKRPIADAL